MPVTAVTGPLANSINAAYNPIMLEATISLPYLPFEVDFQEAATNSYVITIYNPPAAINVGDKVTFSNAGEWNGTYTVSNAFVNDGSVNLIFSDTITGKSDIKITNVGLAVNNRAFVQQIPIAYCDIYFSDIFYKTISKTLPTQTLSTGESIYQFDIQDAAQEIFASDNPYSYGGLPGFVSKNKISCKCSIRGSSIDANNLTVPDGVAPIQGNGSNDPVSGSGGVDSSIFYILNAALQITDDQDLATHLNKYKIGDWNENCFPLTHRTENYIGLNDRDTFPIYLLEDYPNAKIAVRFKYYGQSNEHLKVFDTTVIATGVTTIASGPANIKLLGFDMKDVDSYKIELWSAGGDTLATSPLYRIKSFVDYKRIWFKNSLGQMDGINFLLSDITHASSSSNWQRSESYLSDILSFGSRRISISANDTYTGICSDYLESDMEFVQELFDSPFAVTMYNDIAIPIVISDQKFRKFQQDDRFRYDIQIQFEPSNKRKTLRS